MEQIRKLIRNILIKEAQTIIYSAVCIEDPAEIAKIDKIREQYVPKDKGWKKPHDYHMTISLGKLPNVLLKKGDLNQDVSLTVTAIGISTNAIALEVSGYYTKNDIPHITLAFIGEPANSKNILHWMPIEEFDITGVIRQVAEGNQVIRENTTTQIHPEIDEIFRIGKLYYPKLQVRDGRLFINWPKNKGSYSPGSFKKHLADMKIRKIGTMLKDDGFQMHHSMTTSSIYVKLPNQREIRISDHPSTRFFGTNITVNWKHNIADVYLKVKAAINTNTKSSINEAFELDEDVFYHGTSDVHYDGIIDKGLNSPYLTDDYQKAEYYAEVATDDVGGDPIIFEVRIPSTNNLRVDFHELDEPVTLGDASMKDRINAAYKKYIKKYPKSYNKKWDTVLVDKLHYWMSLSTTNTVRYEGNIPPDNITLL